LTINSKPLKVNDYSLVISQTFNQSEHHLKKVKLNFLWDF